MATAKLSFTKLVVLALAAAVLVELSAAATYIVGNTTGWVNNPSGGATFYSNWASQYTFATGDILVFNYVTGAHNVARVSKNAYDTCNSTSPMSIDTTGPTNITLNATAEYYFFCTVPSHCAQGQKLAINVTSSAPAPAPSPGAPSSPPTTSPSPASPPPSTTTPPPSPTASPPSPTASPPPSTTAPPPSSTASPPPPSSPSPGSPTSPTPGSVSPPPPPASSAPPKAVAAFAVVLMSIAIGVMC